MEFKEDFSETIKEEDSSIFKFVSSGSESGMKSVKIKDLNSKMLVEESVFRDITFYHR